ncbi:SusC/RagA family TonB-linked outer membrane protein [Echinicola strongylocentroti]|uniref:SusC/RagA family TonB-linked outer membrane protein n=1 Tax=Echinicola strongylocentroti TaxID=1795355 RepID=A0A2Z4IIF6_9BACT|nr:SusC/RagA family TonB-linked outer membrane protein [Echinicola strongylocentroti]AWW30912.1 SusC/RagA family TonB-linked outer membrane protein [Echinicola strongylocentroti]
MNAKTLPLLKPVAALALVGCFLQPIATKGALAGEMTGESPLSAISMAEGTVTGTVTSSEDGNPIPGVSITIVGTSKGTITDLDGNYSIVAQEGQTLKYSYLGYTVQTITVGSQTSIDVVLEQDTEELNEVVVTAFGIEKDKKSLGYAVQKVDGEDITTVKASPSAISNLKGRVAGVNITESGSGPGAGVRVIIRGNNSLTQSNQPLYVVDGIPMDNSSTNQGGDMYSSVNTGSGISDLNPDDIESMTVLKGPNAAALYGSRAANGVIMITTKKGKARKGIGVDFSSSAVFSNPMLLPEFQNEYGQGTQGRTPTDYAELRTTGGSWGGKLDGSDQLYWDGTTKPYSAQPDNVENFFNTGGNFVNTIALTGGTEKVTARFSYTNTYNEAMVENSFLKRDNFNLRATAKLSSKLSLDAKATYTSQFTRNRIQQGSQGLLGGVFSMPRNAIMDDFRDYRDEETGLVRNYGENASNPYWTLNYDKAEDTRNRFIGFAKVQYQFTDWLSAHARVGTDWTDIRFESATQPGHWFYPDGRVGFSNNRYQETNADFLFMIDKNITEKLRVTANIGGNHLKQLSQGMSLNGQNLRIPTKTTIGSADQVNYSASVPTERVTNSLYASASFDYAGLVFLDITGRNDWTSTLPSDNWSYFYPSVNLAVMVSEFIDPDQTLMDYLKIRGSWASVGKDASAWSLQNSYNLKNKNNSYLGITTLTVPSVWYDQNLSPEFTKTYEVGLDGSFFKNRLYFDFAYYDISSTDLIDIVETDNLAVNPLGRAEVHTNVGEITNKGVEVMLGGTPVENERFTWNTNINFSHNRNELKEFLPDAINRQWNVNNSGSAETRATVGAGYGEIWATDIMTDPETGDWILTASGMPQATAQRVKVGDFQPDYILGFNNSFSYKDFTLKFLIDGRFGGEMYAATQSAMDGAGISTKTLQYREEGIIVDGKIENEDGTFTDNTQSITAQQYWGAMSGIGSNYIMDQTNVRLRELSLTYRLPTAFLGNSVVRSASISFIGRNLFFLYKGFDGGFDPEATLGTSNAGQGYLYYAMPTARSLGFNLNVKF